MSEKLENIVKSGDPVALRDLCQVEFFKNTIWMAREKDGELFMFSGGRPGLNKTGVWQPAAGGDCMAIDASLFPDLKYGDPPRPCELSIAPHDTFSGKELYNIVYMARALADVSDHDTPAHKTAKEIERKALERLEGPANPEKA